MKAIIVPATAELLERFYGQPQLRTVRALVAVCEGEPLCVAGTKMEAGKKIAFADISPAMREHFRKTGMRMARLVMGRIREEGAEVFAVADTETEAAPRFLERLGFAPLREGVYAWRA